MTRRDIARKRRLASNVARRLGSVKRSHHLNFPHRLVFALISSGLSGPALLLDTGVASVCSKKASNRAHHVAKGNNRNLVRESMPAAGFLGWNYRSQASLKTDPETKSIPVIAITASAMTYKRVTMLAEGFDGFQSKSISVKDFLEEVHRVLDSDHLKAV